MNYLEHYLHHNDPKVNRKIPDRGNARPDKYEILTDENINLKKRQIDLEQ